jgi:hypothetical protein
MYPKALDCNRHYAPVDFRGFNGGPVGPRAVLGDEPRQVRKEAAVVSDAGAAMWLMPATASQPKE